MILTVTPNPSVDQTAGMDALELGEVNRFDRAHLDPAGKGVNVSRMAHRLGWPTIAFGFLAGDVGHIVESALDGEGVQHHFIRVAGQTRINITIVERQSGRATSLYGPGPKVEAGDFQKLEKTLQFWFQGGRVLVLAGSLPPGIPPDFYANLCRAGREAGLKVVVDADDEPLRLALAAQPYLAKPNAEEAARLIGQPVRDMADAVRAARMLNDRGIEVAIVSMGRAGAVCASGGKAWRALPPEVERRSTVGSGDSMVAGLAVALARGDSIVEGLKLGSAAGAATAASTGTSLGTAEMVKDLFPRAKVEPITP